MRPNDPLEWPIKPMLAYLVGEPFDSSDDIYEAQWNGIRCIAYLEPGRTRLQNRLLADITHQFPDLAQAHDQIGQHSAIVNCEIIVPEEGRPNRTLITKRSQANDPETISRLASEHPALLIAFDILVLDGEMVTERPLLERKDLLKRTIQQTRNFVVGTWVVGTGTSFLAQVSKLQIDGIVAKLKSSPYLPGQRSAHWLKINRFKSQDCLVCGYTEGMGRRAGLFGALVLGAFRAGELIHLGQVGSGFDASSIEELHRRFEHLKTDVCPFEIRPQIERPVTWLEPEVVCEIQYTEWTADGKLRAPRFVRVRDDKPKEDCEIEEITPVLR